MLSCREAARAEIDSADAAAQLLKVNVFKSPGVLSALAAIRSHPQVKVTGTAL